MQHTRLSKCSEPLFNRKINLGYVYFMYVYVYWFAISGKKCAFNKYPIFCCMYFHHGIAGTVGDVGGNMNVMQQTTEEEELLDCNAILSEGNHFPLYLWPFQGSRKKKRKKLCVLSIPAMVLFIFKNLWQFVRGVAPLLNILPSSSIRHRGCCHDEMSSLGYNQKQFIKQIQISIKSHSQGRQGSVNTTDCKR